MVCCHLYSECRSMNENPSLYPEAKGILTALKQKGVTMAVASRTPTPDIARCFLDKLSLLNHFADIGEPLSSPQIQKPTVSLSDVIQEYVIQSHAS